MPSPMLPKTIVNMVVPEKNNCFPKNLKQEQEVNHFLNGLGSLGIRFFS